MLLAGGGLLIYLLLPRRRSWGGLLLGLFLLLIGMERMTAAAAPLAELDTVRRLGGMTEHPAAAVLAGAVVTGVLQSSSAAIGILQAFSAAGTVAWGAGVPLVLGETSAPAPRCCWPRWAEGRTRSGRRWRT